VQPTEEAAPLPFHTHAVQVDAFVKVPPHCLRPFAASLWCATAQRAAS
jgi:hypothetical protein